MAKTVSPEALAAAIEAELSQYSDHVRTELDQAAEKSAQKLVKLTKASAPVGYRGKFKRSLTYKKTSKAARTPAYTWGAGGGEYRLTHLLVHGHATRDGGRARGSDFLKTAMDEVLPEFEDDVRRAIQNG